MTVGNCNQLEIYSKLTYSQAYAMSKAECPRVDNLKPYRKQADPYDKKSYDQLNKRQKAVIDLWIFHEMTIHQIAQTTGYHHSTVSDIITKYLGEC